MKKILIDIHPHFNFHNVLSSIKLKKKKSINIEFITFDISLKKNAKFNYLSNKIKFKYDEILNISSDDINIHSDLDRDEIYRYLDLMLSDPKLISIFERSFFYKLYNTKRIRIISTFFFQAINFLRKIKISSYILYASPHNIYNYIMRWACQALSIDVIYIQESLLPWRHYIMLEKKNNKYLFNTGDKWDQNDDFFINDLKQKINQDNYLAPYIKENNKQFFTFAGELENYWKRPDLIFNKFYIYNYYKKITKNFKLPKSDYIFFPLHYSPERSTLPDGGKFFEQFRAIHEIRSKLGNNIKIIVKEHPSIFKYMCHWGERNKNFYKVIHDLGNIIFAPINFPTIKIIKNSSMIISINSSVNFEAALLNKYSFYMSNHRLFGQESTNIKNFINLNKKKTASIILKPYKSNIFNRNWFEKYTYSTEKINFKFLNNIHSMKFERSKFYSKVIQIVINDNIEKNIKRINDVL